MAYQDRLQHSLGLLGRITASSQAAKQTPYYQTFAASSVKDWNRNQAAYTAGALEGVEQPEDGWDKFWRPVEGVLNALTAAGSGVMNVIDKQNKAAKEVALSGDWGEGMAKTLLAGVGGVFMPNSVQRHFWDGFSASWNSDTKSPSYMTGSKLIESVTDTIGSVDPAYTDTEDNVNPWVKGGFGFVADVALDPVTYLPGGIIASGVRGGLRGAKAAEEGSKLAGAAKGIVSGVPDQFAMGRWSKAPKPVGLQQWTEVRQYNKVDQAARRAGLNTPDLLDVVDEMAAGAGRTELDRVLSASGKTEDEVMELLGSVKDQIPAARRIFDGVFELPGAENLGIRRAPALATVGAEGISRWKHPQDAKPEREVPEWAKSEEALQRDNDETLARAAAQQDAQAAQAAPPTAKRPAPTPTSQVDDAVVTQEVAREAAGDAGATLSREYEETLARAQRELAENRRAQAADEAARAVDDEAVSGVPWTRESTAHARASRNTRRLRAVQGSRAVQAKRLLEGGQVRQLLRMDDAARTLNGAQLRYREIDGPLQPIDRSLPRFSGPQRALLDAQAGKLPPYRRTQSGKPLFDRSSPEYTEWSDALDAAIGSTRRYQGSQKPVSLQLTEAFQRYANQGMDHDAAWTRALADAIGQKSLLLRRPQDYGEAIGDVLEGSKKQGGIVALWRWMSHADKRAYDETQLAEIAERLGVSILDIPAEMPFVKYLREAGKALYTKITQATQSQLEAVRNATVIGGDKIAALSKTQSPASGIRDLYAAHTNELATFLSGKGVPPEGIEALATDIADEAAAIVVETTRYSAARQGGRQFESESGYETAVFPNEHVTTGEQAVHTRVINQRSEGVAARLTRTWVDTRFPEFSDTARMQLYQHVLGEVQLQMQRFGMVARAEINPRVTRKFINEVDDASDLVNLQRQWSFLSTVDVMRSLDLDLITDLFYSSRNKVGESEWSFPPTVLAEAGTFALKIAEAKVPVAGTLTEFRGLTQAEAADMLSAFIRESVRVATKDQSLFVKNWVEPQREVAEALMDQLAVALTNAKTIIRLQQSNARNGAIAYAFGKAGANAITRPVKEAIDRVVTMAGNGLHNGKVAAEFNRAIDQLRSALAREAEQTGLTKQDLEWMISEQDVYRYAALHMTPAAGAFVRFQNRMQNATMRTQDGKRIPEAAIDAHADKIGGTTPPKTPTREKMLRETQVAGQRERIAQNAELSHQAAAQRLEEISRSQDPNELAEAAREAPQALLSDTLRLQEQTLRGTQGVEADAVAELEHRTARAADDAAAADRQAAAAPPETRDDMIALYGDRYVTPEQGARIEETVNAYRATAGDLPASRLIAEEGKRARAALRAARIADGTLPIEGRVQAIWLAKIAGELLQKGKLSLAAIKKQFAEENVGGWTSRELQVLVSRGIAEEVRNASGALVGFRALKKGDEAGEVMTRLVNDPHIRDDADLAEDAVDTEDAQRLFDGRNTSPTAADAADARRDTPPAMGSRERQGMIDAAEAAAKQQADEATLAPDDEASLLTGEGMRQDVPPAEVELNSRAAKRSTIWAERLSGMAGLRDVKSDIAMRQVRAQDVSSNYEHFLERDVVQALMREHGMTLQQAADLTDSWFLQYARAGSDEGTLKWLEQFAGTPMEVIAGNFHKAMSILFQHSAWTSIWARAGLNSDHIRKAIKLSPLGASPAAWVPSGLTGWEMAKFWTQEDSFLKYIGGDPELKQFRAIDLMKGYNWALHHAGITPNIAADLVNKFGHEAFGFPKNWSADEAAKAGFVKFTSKGGLGEWLDGIDVYFPKQMQEQFEAAERFVDYVRTLPQNELGKLIRVTDKVTGVLKSSLTLWRPGHHVVNIMGEALMNLLVGVTNPARYAHAFAVMRAGGEWSRGTVFGHNGLKDIEMFAAEYGLDAAGAAGKTLRTRIGGKERQVSYAQAYQFLDRAGLLINHNTAEDIVSIADDVMHANGRFDGRFGAIVRANRGLGEFSARRDNVFRVAHALDILEKRGFRSWEEAADVLRKEVYEAHPTMQTLSGFEQKVMRRVFYFYTWQRQALTMVLKSILERPGMLTIPAKLNYEASVALGGAPQSIGQPMPDDETLPSFVSGNILGPHWYDEEGNIHSLSINAPQLDILQSFFGNMKFNPDQDLAANMRDNGFEFLRENTIGMASPILKAPTELLSGTQFRGSGLSQPIDDGFDYTVDQTGLGYISRLTGRNLYNNDGWLGYRADVLDDDSPADQEFRAGVTGTNWFSGLRYNQPSRYAGSAEYEREEEAARIEEDATRNWLGNLPERVVDPATGEYVTP